MLIGLTPGRALRWAPRWDHGEHSVLFDACSGDYWVLAEATRQLLEAMQAHGPLTLADVTARIWSGDPGDPGDPGGSGAERDEMRDGLIGELVHSGLVVAWVDGKMAASAALAASAA